MKDKIIQIMIDSSEEAGENFLYGLSESGKLYAMKITMEKREKENGQIYLAIARREWILLLDSPGKNEKLDFIPDPELSG